jgi:hypothetical protein
MAELFGRKTGLSQGRGGSMHLFSPEIGLLGTSGIVGPCILQAAGGGYTFQLLGKKNVVNDRSNFRRSVYRFIFRTVPDPFMEALDCPDAAQLSPQRGESITAVQTLATMNDKFVARQCELMAERIQARYSTAQKQVAEAYRIVNCRAATQDELSTVTDYVEVHGLANACRLLVNTNEFMFVD